MILTLKGREKKKAFKEYYSIRFLAGWSAGWLIKIINLVRDRSTQKKFQDKALYIKFQIQTKE